ncbi:MAG: UvrD-helicase domain-containing protein, partial [Pseudomonadales bacterium]|nr:UvrD-helicase domain-containing protein [Pseudomonadales bacterium]
KEILQKRFEYVFVDEMQDMDKHQYEILEKIFFDKNNNSIHFQRIGDKNQAIFNGDAKLEEIWNDRENLLELRGSYRLTPQIAQIVQYFALTPSKIEGRKTHPDGSKISIKPHIIVFDDDSINLYRSDKLPRFYSLKMSHWFTA